MTNKKRKSRECVLSYLSDCFVFDSCFSIGMGTFVLGKIIWRVNIESDKIFPETFYIREFYTCNSGFRVC